MSRGALLLAVALTLALSPTAAAGQSEAQPDLMFVSRHGRVLTGDNIYNDDGVGQQRSVIVERRIVLTVRLENDGGESGRFTIAGSPGNGDFIVRYGTRLSGTPEPTLPVQNAEFALPVVPGAVMKLPVVVTAKPDAPLGATLTLTISATDGIATDAIRATITKVSKPERAP